MRGEWEMTKRQQVRLVTFAWGLEHLRDLMAFALPAALAPGNLPALCAEFDCSVAIVTEGKFFGYVRAHQTTRFLGSICSVHLFALDDLLSEPWQYGMTLTYAINRGFEDLGPMMTDVYILFLNADFILADGCYRKLIDRIQNGERTHLSPSYCVRGS